MTSDPSRIEKVYLSAVVCVGCFAPVVAFPLGMFVVGSVMLAASFAALAIWAVWS